MPKKDYNFVRNLLLDTDFLDEKIASLADVTLAFVQKIRLELAEQKLI